MQLSTFVIESPRRSSLFCATITSCSRTQSSHEPSSTPHNSPYNPTQLTEAHRVIAMKLQLHCR